MPVSELIARVRWHRLIRLGEGRRSATSNIHNIASGYEKLPKELRLQIYSYLDYGAALSLSQASRYFLRDAPAEGVDREQRATYVYHAETFKKNRKRLACFVCLRVLERNAFEKANRRGEYDRFGALEFERICFECSVDKGHVSSFELWKRTTARRVRRIYGGAISVLVKKVQGNVLQ